MATMVRSTYSTAKRLLLLDLAPLRPIFALLHERGIWVTLIARTSKLGFAAAPRSRGMVAKAIAPTSGIGNSWTLAACAYAPWLVHLLPDDLVAALSNAKALGPMGSPFTRDRVVGKIPLLLGRELGEINLRGDRVELQLTTADGQHETARADHVIFATGYRVDVGQLPFLGSDIKTRMRLVGGSPRLTDHTNLRYRDCSSLARRRQTALVPSAASSPAHHTRPGISLDIYRWCSAGVRHR